MAADRVPPAHDCYVLLYGGSFKTFLELEPCPEGRQAVRPEWGT